MADRDEAQAARWGAIRLRVGRHLRAIRAGRRSQATLSWEMEELGYHVTQSMISRYEQGQLDAPLSLERLVGWALCCDALSSRESRELLALAGYYLPWTDDDLRRFDDLLRSYRALSKPDQTVLRRKLLWHVLGIQTEDTDHDAAG